MILLCPLVYIRAHIVYVIAERFVLTRLSDIVHVDAGSRGQSHNQYTQETNLYNNYTSVPFSFLQHPGHISQ